MVGLTRSAPLAGRKDRIVPENVSIAYRGAHYAIGQGPQFYGIWHAVAPQSQPIEWWPLTPEGWSAAWARFASVEVPGTIAPVMQAPGQVPEPSSARAQPTSTPSVAAPSVAAPGDATPSVAAPGDAATLSDAIAGVAAAPTTLAPDAPSVIRRARIAAAVLGLGVVFGIAGLFPSYVGSSLASQRPDLATHVTYLAAWSLSAVLIATGGGRMRVGALLGLGVSAVTLGFFFADVGTPIASGMHLAGAGLWLGIGGWLTCTIGVGLAFWTGLKTRDGNGAVARRGPARHLGRASSHEIPPLVTLVLAAIGAAIAFAPAWDRFSLRAANGFSQVITAGNAFANPAPVIAGDVLVMVGLVAVAVVAAFWRPLRLGGALVAGAIVAMLAQAISALVQVTEPTSPTLFGISQAQANQAGLSIVAGLTPMFWVFCAFVATMILLCVWMLLSSESAAQPVTPQVVGPNFGAPTPAAGTSYSQATQAQASGQ